MLGRNYGIQTVLTLSIVWSDCIQLLNSWYTIMAENWATLTALDMFFKAVFLFLNDII